MNVCIQIDARRNTRNLGGAGCGGAGPGGADLGGAGTGGTTAGARIAFKKAKNPPDWHHQQSYEDKLHRFSMHCNRAPQVLNCHIVDRLVVGLAELRITILSILSNNYHHHHES